MRSLVLALTLAIALPELAHATSDAPTLDSSAAVPATAASAASPTAASPPAEPPLTRRWWFWTAVASSAVVVIVGVGVVAGLSGSASHFSPTLPDLKTGLAVRF